MWHKILKILSFFMLFLTIVNGSCGAGLLACGDACYLSSQYCCLNNVLTQIKFCPQNDPTPQNTGTITTIVCNKQSFSPSQCCSNGEAVLIGSCTTNTPAPTPITPAPPSVTPTQPSSSSRADVTIVNSCKVNLFIEARMGGAGSPLDGYTSPVRSLPVGQSISYNIPDTGASGTRFWAKYGCDSNGKNCLIGDSMQYWPNPPGGCPPGGCQVPIDSLFEATFGCKPGSSCNAQSPTTWFDTSQVDGWTLPYRLTLYGATNKCDCAGDVCPNLTIVDGSHLDLAKCPTNDDASDGGKYPTSGNKAMSGLDLRLIANNTVIGCMSPCKKLNYGAPSGYGLSESTIPTIYMCCPTPNPSNCKISEGCILPAACSSGPVIKTKYVNAVHSMAPGVYSYSYDDGVGLHACPAGTVQYQMEFCPSGSAVYPLPL